MHDAWFACSRFRVCMQVTVTDLAQEWSASVPADSKEGDFAQAVMRSRAKAFTEYLRSHCCENFVDQMVVRKLPRRRRKLSIFIV